MKKLILLAASIALASFSFADDAKSDQAYDKGTKAYPKTKAKSETIKGMAQCAKCTMDQAEKCQTVVVVGEGEKAKTYKVEGAAEFHSKICAPGTKLEVVAIGHVHQAKDGSLTIAASKIKEVAAK